MSSVRLKDLLETLPGSLTEPEALSLFRAARFARGGALVNTGPCHDKAAVALVVGMASHAPGDRQKYYCLEAQAPSGNGAQMPRGTYQSLRHTLAKMGCESLADAMIVPSANDLAAWREPVSTLRVQAADYASMRAQIDKWLPFLTPAAAIVIQGPVEDKAGRRRLIAELQSTGKFMRFDDAGNSVELRCVDSQRPVQVSTGDSSTEVVKKYARVHGYEETSLLSRIAHSSFVSLRHRYVYIEIPKAACTTMKYFLVELEKASCQFERLPYLRETKQSMLIHQRDYVGIPTLLALQGTELHALLSGRTDNFIFALVRNPFSRLVSAFESKVRLCEPGMSDSMGRRWSAASAGADVREAFSDFVRTNLEGFSVHALEHHFISQHRLLTRLVIPYTKIFQVERFKEFEEAFFAHLRGHGAQAIPAFKDWNRLLYPDWRHYYDRATAERVVDFYEADFEAYGYDPESWRTEGEPPPLLTSAAEAYWRMEVIERNEMIDFLYALLRAAN